MSNDVEAFVFYRGGLGGERLYQREPESCLACISIQSLGYEDTSWATKADTLLISFEVEVPWVDFNHPLIQTLSPGMSQYDEYSVSVPLAGIPFDQIICALRLVRSYSDISDYLVSDTYTRINSDSQVSMFAFDKVDILLAMSKHDTKGWRVSDIGSLMVGSSFPKELNGFNTPRKTINGLLEEGVINPGWLPPFNECVGYLKSFYCIPPELYGDPAKQGECARYAEQVSKWQAAYMEKYGKYPKLSADHALCVAAPLKDVV